MQTLKSTNVSAVGCGVGSTVDGAAVVAAAVDSTVGGATVVAG